MLGVFMSCFLAFWPPLNGWTLHHFIQPSLMLVRKAGEFGYTVYSANITEALGMLIASRYPDDERNSLRALFVTERPTFANS